MQVSGNHQINNIRCKTDIVNKYELYVQEKGLKLSPCPLVESSNKVNMFHCTASKAVQAYPSLATNYLVPTLSLLRDPKFYWSYC